MINKIVIKELRHPSVKRLCESTDGCTNIALNKIWMRGEGCKCVCDEHTIKFFKMASEIKLDEE